MAGRTRDQLVKYSRSLLQVSEAGSACLGCAEMVYGFLSWEQLGFALARRVRRMAAISEQDSHAGISENSEMAGPSGLGLVLLGHLPAAMVDRLAGLFERFLVVRPPYEGGGVR